MDLRDKVLLYVNVILWVGMVLGIFLIIWATIKRHDWKKKLKAYNQAHGILNVSHDEFKENGLGDQKELQLIINKLPLYKRIIIIGAVLIVGAIFCLLSFNFSVCCF